MKNLQQLSQHKHFKKIAATVFFGLSALIWMSVQTYNHFYTSTEDAYINANVVQIAPRITGKVVHLAITNNQYVKKDQPLFDIDPAPFQTAVDSAQAQVAIAEAQLAKAAIEAKRTAPLVKQKYLSPQDGDNTIASLKTAAGNLEYAKAGLAQAQLNFAYTNIKAPVSGWVTNLTLRTGDVISANQPLFVLISDEEFWVDANFKETEMQRIQPGQLATVVTDLYPHHPFQGRVDSISGGAGSAFSLLPPQNATGNWVKVTQRIPVRVHIIQPDTRYPLRIGISATVTIKLKRTA